MYTVGQVRVLSSSLVCFMREVRVGGGVCPVLPFLEAGLLSLLGFEREKVNVDKVCLVGY